MIWLPTTMDANDQAELDKLRNEPAQLVELFTYHRSRLRRAVALRLDRKLQQRIDPSDVLQDAYLEAERRLTSYLEPPQPALPPFLWLRFITIQRLLQLHRFHGAERRDSGREQPFTHDPAADDASLADALLGALTTPSQAAVRNEQRSKLLDALGQLDAIDREVIALRSFEELSCDEAAATLGITPAAVSKRFLRAIERLRAALDRPPQAKRT
jgi:RNA polymerase sigma-70 factor (ECF subfamily)